MGGGQCWTKEGRPKKRYETRRAAKRGRARALAEFDNDPGGPYRCTDCGYFHLGHYPTNESIRDHLRSRHRTETS